MGVTSHIRYLSVGIPYVRKKIMGYLDPDFPELEIDSFVSLCETMGLEWDDEEDDGGYGYYN